MQPVSGVGVGEWGSMTFPEATLSCEHCVARVIAQGRSVSKGHSRDLKGRMSVPEARPFSARPPAEGGLHFL